MSVRSASRGNPAASSIRLALRTSSIVATRRASFVRWVFRCFGRRCLSSAPKLSAISLMPSMMRFQLPPRPESLNHTLIPYVNNLPAKLMDGKHNLHVLLGCADREITPYSCIMSSIFFNELLPDNVRPRLLHTYMYAQPSCRSINFNSTPSERGRVPSGRFGAMVIHFWRPPGSSSGAGDLLRRVLGRAGPGCSTSFRRRDRGLCVVLLPPSSSVLTRTVERHSR